MVGVKVDPGATVASLQDLYMTAGVQVNGSRPNAHSGSANVAGGVMTLARRVRTPEGPVPCTVLGRAGVLSRGCTPVSTLGPDEETLARFEREVQLTARISHPNIVSVYDFGRSPDGAFYYAMEFLDGVDLQRLVEEHGPLPPSRVVHVLAQMAEALSEAHAVGLIHQIGRAHV